MKKLIASVVAGVALLAVTGCEAGTVTTTPDNASADGGGKGSGTATVGDPVTITGNAEGSKVQVTVKKVVATRSKSAFMTPDKGNKLVAVQFLIVNTGTAAYDDAPSNGAVVVDAKGQQYEATPFYDKIRAGTQLPTTVKLAPGNKALGYLVFEVPRKATVAQVQFSMDSGFGDTAQWNVR